MSLGLASMKGCLASLTSLVPLKSSGPGGGGGGVNLSVANALSISSLDNPAKDPCAGKAIAGAAKPRTRVVKYTRPNMAEERRMLDFYDLPDVPL